MLISEVVKKYPQTATIFLEYGLHCIGCAFAKDETIGETVRIHGIELEKFLDSLNRAIGK